MDQLLRELYVKMQQEINSADKIDKNMKEKISDLLKEERDKLDKKEYELLQDQAFLLASAAEENGFVKGFRYAFRLFMECIYEN